APERGVEVRTGHRPRRVGGHVLVLELMGEDDAPEEGGGADQGEPLDPEGHAGGTPRLLAPSHGGHEGQPGGERRDEPTPREELPQVHGVRPRCSASAWYLEGHFTSSCSAANRPS